MAVNCEHCGSGFRFAVNAREAFANVRMHLPILRAAQFHDETAPLGILKRNEHRTKRRFRRTVYFARVKNHSAPPTAKSNTGEKLDTLTSLPSRAPPTCTLTPR